MSARRQSERVRISKPFRALMEKFAPRNEDGELDPSLYPNFPIEHTKQNRKLAKSVVQVLPDEQFLKEFWELLKADGRTTEAAQVRRLWQMQLMSQSFLESTKRMWLPRK